MKRLDLEALQVAEGERREGWKIEHNPRVRRHASDDVRIRGKPIRRAFDVEMDQEKANQRARKLEYKHSGYGQWTIAGVKDAWRCTGECCKSRGVSKRRNKHRKGW